ncbi:MAG: biotin-dependent carboxyltransferase family protein [Clostridiales bacterium]|nr:biotin-dependent carboxyltransferase family protein [Clostridiales bacterium]
MSIRVIHPGALTTVQDFGRSGFQAFGMSCSGVMDRQAFHEANYLVGNQAQEAVLECTLFGGIYQFEADTVIALTGADMVPTIDGNFVSTYRPLQISKGQTLMLGTAATGCRTYLAVAGGIDVPVIMGSRSTNLKCALGGYEGRALQAGDQLPIGNSTISYSEISDRCLEIPQYPEALIVRVIPGPQDDYFTEKGLDIFYQSTYTISGESDRMGYRLTGPAIESKHGTDIISDATVFGSIQVTPSGQPIVLLADRQTTGGYAKIATVCTEDLPKLAQARPGYTVQFHSRK